MLEGAVIGALRIVGKTAGRQLPHVQMIAYTFATVTFAGARFITAVAGLKIIFIFTLHKNVSFA